MLVLDAGTTWSKIAAKQPSRLPYEFSKYFVKEENGSSFYIMPSKNLNDIPVKFDRAAGHMILNRLKDKNNAENEVIALIQGFKRKIKDDNAVIIDVGSRDIKCAVFKNGKFKDLDWNAGCSSAAGAAIEMLMNFYKINDENLKFSAERYSVTCSIFGLEKIMDDIAKGCSSETAVSKFIHGIAYNAWCFAKKPEKLYLSGGLCENQCFIKSLESCCETVPLGRFLLAEGLLAL